MKKIVLFLGVLALVLSAEEIHQAVREGDLAAVKRLVEEKPGLVNLKDTSGAIPLHYAAAVGQKEIVELLLEKGADINAETFNGDTPLHWAVFSGQKPIVELLLNKGSHINIWDKFGNSPLNTAVRCGHTEVVNLLTAKGAALEEEIKRNKFFLHEAASQGQNQLVQALIGKGADITGKNRTGGTLLHSAAAGGLAECMKQMIARGMDVNTRNTYGETPLHEAAANGHENVIQLLAAKGADINARSFDGRTPLHTASDNHHKETIDLLISKGAANTPKEFPLLEGEYLGQKKPGLTPGIFAPGIVSTPAVEFDSTFTPEGKEYYFTRYAGNPPNTSIMMVKQENHRWTEPRMASFSSPYNDYDHNISPEGNKIFFCSERPLTGKGDPKDPDIWMVETIAAGWSEPVNLGPPLNSDSNEFYPSITREGTIYFRSDRPGGFGQGDLYRSKFIDGKYSQPGNLGNTINTDFDELNVFIFPDESCIIWVSRGYPGSYGDGDLYISFRKPDGSWNPAKNMGESINSPQNEYTPILTPDGKFLFFASDKGGNDDIYWVDARVIEKFRK